MRPDEQRILVTGGAGFIGSQFVTQLNQAGSDVHVIDNYFTGEEELLPDTVTQEPVDIRDAEAVKDAVTSYAPTVIVHLAAIHHIPYCNANPEETFNVNVVGTRNVLSAAREVEDVSAALYASSAAVYPPDTDALSEETTPDPIDIYGRTKLIGEDLVREFSVTEDVPAVSARLFNVYGPNETNLHLIPAILDQIESGNSVIELGNLHPKRDFVSVFDVSRAFTSILNSLDNGYRVYNVGTGTAHSVREVVECVDSIIDGSLEIEQDEERVREVDRPNLLADVQRIHNETGWSPEMDLRTGLKDLLRTEKVLT